MRRTHRAPMWLDERPPALDTAITDTAPPHGVSLPLTDTLTPSVAHRVSADLTLQLLALTVGPDQVETYHVAFRTTQRTPFRAGTLRHIQAQSWELVDAASTHAHHIVWCAPQEVFLFAMGDVSSPDAATLATTAPHWPTSMTARLASRGLAGAGTLAFDGRWFLSNLTGSAMDSPLVLVGATTKLGLTGLTRASAIVQALAEATLSDVPNPTSQSPLARELLRALDATRRSSAATPSAWDGRLIGESPYGDLEQLGGSLEGGCRAAIGQGPLRVDFAPTEPLGLGLGPHLPTDGSNNRPHQASARSAGLGAIVGEVDARSAAARAGVTVSMRLTHLSPPAQSLPSRGPHALAFEGVLDAIDTRRDAGGLLTVTFETAAPNEHLYAVEMAGAAMLGALASTLDIASVPWSSDPGVGASLNALCGPALLWREDTPRLFLGEAGSITSAHTDICPQLQLAHGLCGTKFLGIAAPGATARLAAKFAGTDGPDGEEPTFISTDRPLTPKQAQLLCDADISVVLLQPGDLAVFDSGALHVASNGAHGLAGALYHGLMTAAAIPKLRAAATKPGGSAAGSDGAYQHHLFAADLLALVEQ